MSAPVFRSFHLLTGGEDAEVDRLGVMWQCLEECDEAQGGRMLAYLTQRFMAAAEDKRLSPNESVQRIEVPK